MNAVLDKDMVTLNRVVAEYGRPELAFSRDEWFKLSELSKILLPFLIATDNLQAEKVSNIIIWLCNLKHKLNLKIYNEVCELLKDVLELIDCGL